jgi:3-dehydro-4-phosphotetronate decarboxylase
MNSEIEHKLESLCATAASFYARGLAFGSTGNLSVRVGGDLYVTPTGSSLGNLKPADIAQVRISDGAALNDRKASKETPFHLACFRAAGERASALMHLHSTYTVALSCLDELDPASPMPVFTPYYLMRVQPLAVIPYFRPGSQLLADAIGAAAADHDSFLLRNHGSITLGASIEEAVDRIEELEETAKLWFLLRDQKLRLLTAGEQADIIETFRKPRALPPSPHPKP